MTPHEPGRQNPEPGVHWLPGSPTIVFLTVRTFKGGKWLANGEAHTHLDTAWRNANGWAVGDYLLMPDHLHCFCSPLDGRFSIEQWITYWKRSFRRLHQHDNWRFQSRGWHHRMRREESCSEKWEYVRQNPMRAGLVNYPEEWPYRGRINELRW